MSCDRDFFFFCGEIASERKSKNGAFVQGDIFKRRRLSFTFREEEEKNSIKTKKIYNKEE